jgi:hypothetical protein
MSPRLLGILIDAGTDPKFQHRRSLQFGGGICHLGGWRDDGLIAGVDKELKEFGLETEPRSPSRWRRHRTLISLNTTDLLPSLSLGHES